jgi:hypothetical protein
MPKIVGFIPYGVAPSRAVGELPRLPTGFPCTHWSQCESENCCDELMRWGIIPYCAPNGLECIERDMQMTCEREENGTWLGWQEDIERWVCEVPPADPPEPQAPKPLPSPSPPAAPPAAPAPQPAPPAPAPAVTEQTPPSGPGDWAKDNPYVVAAAVGAGVLLLVALAK